MGTQHFSHMALTCKDPIAIERFYTRYFGFHRARVVPLNDETQIVFIKHDDMYLELFQAAEKAPFPPVRGNGPEYPGWRHLAFQVENIDEALEALGHDADKTLGPISFDKIIPGWRTVWIADPEGNIVEISQGFVDQQNPPPLPIAPIINKKKE